MTWFRRAREAVTEPAPAPPEDDPTQLRLALFAQNRHINESAGRLPGRAVVIAREITDTLREVLDTAELRPLDARTLSSLQAITGDYLPTTLGQYLALDDVQLSQQRANGSTPTQSLIEQLHALADAAEALLVATRNQDADALMTQGSFLRTKFTRSDLDL